MIAATTPNNRARAARARFKAMATALVHGIEPSPRNALLIVPEVIHEGQCYRLPSGAVAIVVRIDRDNVGCAYTPGQGEDAIGQLWLRRDFFMAQAHRVMDDGTVLPPPCATDSAWRP